MRRILATTVVLFVAACVSACGDNVQVNFDKNGREKACTALNSVKSEVAGFTSPDGTETAGSAQTALADINDKLTAATDTKTGFTTSVLAPLTAALDSAGQQLDGVDPATPLGEVPGASNLQSAVRTSFDNLSGMFKCG